MRDAGGDLVIGPELIGASVKLANRPDWGVGKVQRVQTTQAGGSPTHRVGIQFPVVGHRVVRVPPARLLSPEPEPERTHGWIETLGKGRLDDRLRALPAAITEELAGPSQRFLAISQLYAYDETPASLIRWARAQIGVGDPLSQWTRDELLEAFRVFCQERDSELRVVGALLKKAGGDDALKQALHAMPEEIQARMLAALRRVI